MFKGRDLKVLDQQLNARYETLFGKRTESLRIQLLDNPKQISDSFDLTRLVIRTRRDSDLIGLALMSWYMTDEVRFLLQLQLLEFKLSVPYGLMEILLNSKEYALSWLLLQEKWNERDFFGNVLDRRLARIWEGTRWFRTSDRKVKRYTGYCRGYQESNRRAPSSLPSELRAKLTVQEEEQRRLAYDQRTFLLLCEIEEFLETS